MSTKESGEKFLQEGLGPEREDIDFDLESLFRETVLSSVESQEAPMDGDKPVAADVLTDIIEEAYGEETNREELVSTSPEESMAEEVLRFVNPSVHHGDEVEGRPKRLRPSVTRWMGREILDEDPDWENILLSQEDERLREDYDDPEQKFYDELDRLSLAAELKHNYTLIHDDVVDNDETRRGVPTLWKDISNRLQQNGYEEEKANQQAKDLAVNMGDWLNDISTLIITKSDFTDRKSMKMLELLQDGGARIAQGQDKDLKMEDIPNKDVVGERNHPVTDHLMDDGDSFRDLYLDMIEKKTSVLYGTASAIGAVAADASREEIEEAARYGTASALAFQIRDDMVELQNAAEYGLDSGELGKSATDVTNGKTTLAYLTAVNRAQEELGRIEEIEDGEVEAMLTQLKAGFSREEAEDEAGGGLGKNPGEALHVLKNRKRRYEWDEIMLREAYGDDLSDEQVRDVAQRVLHLEEAEALYDDCAAAAENTLESIGVEPGEGYGEGEALYGLIDFMQNRDW